MDLRSLSRVALASKVLADAAREEGQAARDALAEQMADGGVERVRVTGDDQSDYGTVVLTPGRRAASIVDEQQFAAWVASRYPDEVVMSVKVAFRERLLHRATKAGDPVDVETGEAIPGMAMRQGDPYLVTRPSVVAKDRMKTALTTHGLLTLEASSDGQS